MPAARIQASAGLAAPCPAAATHGAQTCAIRCIARASSGSLAMAVT